MTITVTIEEFKAGHSYRAPLTNYGPGGFKPKQSDLYTLGKLETLLAAQFLSNFSLYQFVAVPIGKLTRPILEKDFGFMIFKSDPYFKEIETVWGSRRGTSTRIFRYSFQISHSANPPKYRPKISQDDIREFREQFLQ